MGVEVTKDERDKKFLDHSRVDLKNHELTARWVRKDQTNIQRKLDAGYEFVNATTNQKAEVLVDPRSGELRYPDGSKHRGDLVLMQIHRYVKTKRDREKVEEAYRRVGGIKDADIEAMRRAGLAVIDEPGEGHGYTRSFDEKDHERALREESKRR